MSGADTWRVDEAADELIVPDVRGGHLRVPAWSAVAARYFGSMEMPFVIAIIQQNPEMFDAVRVREGDRVTG